MLHVSCPTSFIIGHLLLSNMSTQISSRVFSESISIGHGDMPNIVVWSDLVPHIGLNSYAKNLFFTWLWNIKDRFSIFGSRKNKKRGKNHQFIGWLKKRRITLKRIYAHIMWSIQVNLYLWLIILSSVSFWFRIQGISNSRFTGPNWFFAMLFIFFFSLSQHSGHCSQWGTQIFRFIEKLDLLIATTCVTHHRIKQLWTE